MSTQGNLLELNSEEFDKDVDEQGSVDEVEEELEEEQEFLAERKPVTVQKVFTLKELIEDVSCQELYYDTLCFCRAEQERSVVEAAIDENPNRRKSIMSAHLCIDNLVNAGGLSQRVAIGDASYTIEEFIDILEKEEAEKEDATIYVVATSQALEVLENYSVEKRIAELFQTKEHYIPAYKGILQFCQTPRSLQEITERLNAIGIPTSPALGVVPVYPSFLLDCLQRTGAIIWDTGWCLTEEGRSVLEALTR